MKEARRGLGEYFKFYNEKRWHQNFDRKTPGMVCFESLAQKQAVA
jgi:putative transposase